MAFAISKCNHCEHMLVWLGDRILFPETLSGESPIPDLPETVQETYREAASVLDRSPRASSALARLALQELCAELGEHGDLNTAIGNLVKTRGLRQEVQRALDVIRVTGNQAIHPGQIDPTDTRERATAMFSLINAIAYELITRPKQVDELYERLPETIRAQIDERDK